MLAAINLTLDPAWPWSLPGVGPAALGGVAIVLAALTVWTYLGAASWRRIGLVAALRLLALAVACLLILRPALAFEDVDEVKPTRLFFLLDYSRSMEITDDFNNESRWKNAKRVLATAVVQDALRKLTDAKVETTYYQGADDLRPYDPESQPTGKATDMGTWLREIYQRHGKESNLRGLILLSDGADNGTTFATLEQAAKLRGTCPIYTFGLGRATTSPKRNDIELTDIRVEPDPIPAKGKVKVTGRINASGFENSSVNVNLYIQDAAGTKPYLAATAKHVLSKTEGNEVVLICDAPESAGEIKVTLKVPPLTGEVSTLNNEVSTYASVTKEGVSILWVEGRKRYESVFAIRHALSMDQRFRIFYSERLNEEKPGPEVADWFDFDKRHYDVIVIGDITARRFAGGNSDVFTKIASMISDKGTGLLMMGGYQTLGSEDSDWDAAGGPLASILPVSVRRDLGHTTARVRMQPTRDGLNYLLRVDERNNEEIWSKIFDPLEGANNLGDVRKDRPASTIFARGEGDSEALLVGSNHGKGRLLVFAGDTTSTVWRRTKEALPAYERFWKQMMLYLARQEYMDGNMQIALEKRRLAADSNERLAFSLKARGKNGQEVKSPRFTAKVIGPNKEEIEVPVALEGGEYRGYFLKTHLAGDYRLEASVQAKDADGSDLSAQPSVAHFLAFAQDREMLRPAADHEFLAKIAAASGGQFALADERKLAGLLEELLRQRDNSPRATKEVWPDWRRHPPSETAGDQIATLWTSTALPCYLAFVTLLCVEWYLRRRWGLV